jgi:hypothetical protein
MKPLVLTLRTNPDDAARFVGPGPTPPIGEDGR